MLRRDPDAIFAAHRMDPQRRELYVEGVTDKAFLEWLTGERMKRDARVITIDFVDMPGKERGGNRGRLIDFLSLVDGEPVDIRGLVDADHHRFHGDGGNLPSAAWLTDHRDIESYVLTEANVDTVLRAGCGLLHPSADTVFQSMTECAGFIAAVRLVSARGSLDLPTSHGTWLRSVSCRNGVCVDLQKRQLVASLLQAAGQSLTALDQLLADVAATECELGTLPQRDVLHGKDCMQILTKQLASAGVKVDDAGRLLRATFLRDRLHDFPTLSAIVEYLAGK